MGRDTVVCGVVGKPVYHSKGPILHNRGFAELNLNYVYVPFLVDDFAHFMSVYSESHFRGFRYEFSPTLCQFIDSVLVIFSVVHFRFY